MSAHLKAMLPSPGCDETFKRLKDESKECIRSFRILDVDWPDAIDVVKELCELISDSICTSDGKPVLFHAVHRGLNVYSQNLLEEDYERLRLFLDTLLDEIGSQLDCLVVLNSRRYSTWRPDDCEPFLEWWGKANLDDISLVEGNCSKECIVRSLQLAVLTPEQVELLEGS